MLGATLEQKVWIHTSSNLYPNLYVFLVGTPGIGKTRSIMAAMRLGEAIEMPYAPTSMTMASLVDSLVESKRVIPTPPYGGLDYNSMYIVADELGAFMHEYDPELIPGLTKFYDCEPYSQARRIKDIRIKIEKPQLSIIAGATPTNLMKFVPEIAWEQGFTSRLILVFSADAIDVDDFADRNRPSPTDLIHDLRIINSLVGQFTATQSYQDCIRNWQTAGQAPVPDHPKLAHYNTRRRTHLYKLSMVSAVNRGNDLVLTKADFDQALSWLVDAELMIPEIFHTGAPGADAKAIDEIYYFMLTEQAVRGVVSEHKIVRYARQRVPLNSIGHVLGVMERSGDIAVTGIDKKTNTRFFKALPK